MPQGSPAASSLATLSEVPGTELRQLEATFDNFREFVARYSPWLSDSCIFVETLEEVPVGAPVRLEIWLRDRPGLILALGQVDWVRPASESDEDGPPGVALNITYLDPASTRLIDSIFRLYTGQQSAAMGKDVVETWELDVESLIDQAFPGAPGVAAGGAPGVAAAEGDAASSKAAPPQAEPPAAPPKVQIMAADGTAGDALGWSSPDVEPIDVDGAAGIDVADATPPKVQIMAADGTAGDALGWSSPDVEPIDVGEVVPSLDARDEIADLAQEVEIELPESTAEALPLVDDDSMALDHAVGEQAAEEIGEEIGEETAEPAPEAGAEHPAPLPPSFDAPSPVMPEELSDLEAPAIPVPPIEIEASPASPAPAAPSAPPEAPAQFAIVDAALASTPATADLETLEEPVLEELESLEELPLEELETLEEPALEEPEILGEPTLEEPETLEEPTLAEPEASPPDPDWEERFSAAFSERKPEEPGIEDTGFGFGLVEEPEPPALEVPLSAPAEAAALASAPEPAAPPLAEPSMAVPPPAAPSPAAPLPVAGAAAAMDASDTSFLRRSVLFFLLAVVAIGLLFVWLRSRQTAETPPKVATATEAAPGSEAASPTATPPQTAGGAEAAPPRATQGSAGMQPAESQPGQGQPESTPGGEPSATEPIRGEPAQAQPVQAEPAQTTTPPEPAQAVPPPPVAPPAAVPPPPAAAAASADPAAITADVERLVKGWATAWSEQEPDAFVASYAPDYSPPGTSRREWIRQREVRIQAPASILVQAKDISVEVIDAQRATATFYQDYETEAKHLYTWKTMEMALRPGGWKIVKEWVGR